MAAKTGIPWGHAEVSCWRVGKRTVGCILAGGGANAWIKCPTLSRTNGACPPPPPPLRERSLTMQLTMMAMMENMWWQWMTQNWNMPCNPLTSHIHRKYSIVPKHWRGLEDVCSTAGCLTSPHAYFLYHTLIATPTSLSQPLCTHLQCSRTHPPPCQWVPAVARA